MMQGDILVMESSVGMRFEFTSRSFTLSTLSFANVKQSCSKLEVGRCGQGAYSVRTYVYASTQECQNLINTRIQYEDNLFFIH